MAKADIKTIAHEALALLVFYTGSRINATLLTFITLLLKVIPPRLSERTMESFENRGLTFFFFFFTANAVQDPGFFSPQNSRDKYFKLFLVFAGFLFVFYYCFYTYYPNYFFKWIRWWKK